MHRALWRLEVVIGLLFQCISTFLYKNYSDLCVPAMRADVEVRGHCPGVGSLLPTMRSGDRTQVSRLSISISTHQALVLAYSPHVWSSLGLAITEADQSDSQAPGSLLPLHPRGWDYTCTPLCPSQTKQLGPSVSPLL